MVHYIIVKWIQGVDKKHLAEKVPDAVCGCSKNSGHPGGGYQGKCNTS